MISRRLEMRIAKLEQSEKPQGKTIYHFVGTKSDAEIEREIDEMERNGQLRPCDNLILLSWIRRSDKVPVVQSAGVEGGAMRSACVGD